MSQFLITGGVGDENSTAIADGGSADEATATNGGMHDGDVIGKLGLENGIEVLGPANSCEAVSIGQRRKDADFIGVLVLTTRGHCFGNS